MTMYVKKTLIYVRSLPEHQRKIFAFIATIISAVIIFVIWLFLFSPLSSTELSLGKIDTDTSSLEMQLKPNIIAPVAGLVESFKVFAETFMFQGK